MRVATDYIRHAARAARQCAGDPLGGAPQAPDPEFYKTLAKALEEIAAGLERLGKGEE
jgi:DNA-directed RNA polymerase subunit K/omega